MDQQNDKPKPVTDFRVGGISASVWRNEVQQDGEIRVRYSIRIQKRYRNSDGEYTTSPCFFPQDLPKLQLCVQKAFEFTMLKEGKDRDDAVPV